MRKHLLGVRYLGPEREAARQEVCDYVRGGLRRLLADLKNEPVRPELKVGLLPNGQKPGLDVFGGENSSRTILSTGAAGEDIGFRVRYIDPSSLSLKKGESYWETVETMQEHGVHVIAGRFGVEGLMLHLARVLETVNDYQWVSRELSFISCGEGTREHPTQFMLDVMTIVCRRLTIRWKNSETIRILEEVFARSDADDFLDKIITEALDNLTVAFIGGLHESRVTHTWINAGRWFDIKFIFIAPSKPVDFQVEQWCLDFLGERAQISSDLNDAIKANIAYFIRVQVERLPKHIQEQADEVRRIIAPYRLSQDFLDNFGGEVMDAKPYDEMTPTIPAELRNHPKVIAKMQSSMGRYIRQEVIWRCYNNRFHSEATLLNIPPVEFVPGQNIIKTMKLANKHAELETRYAADTEAVSMILRNGVVINAVRPELVGVVRTINDQFGWSKGHRRLIGEEFRSETLGTKGELWYPNLRVLPQLAGIWILVSPEIRLSLAYPELEAEGRDGYLKICPSLPRAVDEIFKCPNIHCITNSETEPLAKTFFWVNGQAGSTVWLECAFCQHQYHAERVVRHTFGSLIGF